MTNTADSSGKYEPRTVRSVSHAVELMRILARSNSTVTLSVLSRKIGLSKPAVYKLMNSLLAEGLVQRDPTGGYRLGWTAYELAGQIPEARDLARAARFEMMDLAGTVPGAALLSVADNDGVLYVDREQEDPGFITLATIGHRSPLHATASGKVLLAGLSDREIARLLSGPLPPSTTTTLTEPRALATELTKVRVEGFAACWGEHEPTLSSLAVPVRDESGSVRAALAVAISSDLLRRSSPARIVARLQKASQVIARSL
ncbi:IclR family transcriptional regulator [Agromyces binzhouensis]|uniref:IclR family transcriptional regulator n=1 Tax=Agromyces binzhouensis TaxID=1817495 RepID=UPI0036368B0B